MCYFIDTIFFALLQNMYAQLLPLALPAPPMPGMGGGFASTAPPMGGMGMPPMPPFGMPPMGSYWFCWSDREIGVVACWLEHKNLAVVSGLLLRGVPQDSSPPIVFLVFLLSHGESLIRNNMAFFCTSCVDMCCSIFFSRVAEAFFGCWYRARREFPALYYFSCGPKLTRIIITKHFYRFKFQLQYVLYFHFHS